MKHKFDTKIFEYIVEPYGFGKQLESEKYWVDDGIIYKLKSDQYVQSYERLHMVFALPEKHLYEKIKIIHDEISEEIPIDSVEHYVKSMTGYDKLTVHLIEQGNIPLADGQGSVQEYVTFYVVGTNVCYSKDCNVTTVEEIPILKTEEISILGTGEILYLILGITGSGIGGLIFYIIHRRKPITKSPNITNNKTIDLSGYYNKIETPKTDLTMERP